MPSNLTSGKCVVCFSAGPLITAKKDKTHEKILQLYFDGINVKCERDDLLNDICQRCFHELVELYDANSMCVQLDVHMEMLKKRLLERTMTACAKKKPYFINEESKLHNRIYGVWSKVNLEDESMPRPNKKVKLETYLVRTKGDKFKYKANEKETKPDIKKIKIEPTGTGSPSKSKSKK